MSNGIDIEIKKGISLDDKLRGNVIDKKNEVKPQTKN
jgi:hypothetical protein